jgi:hypothetical protein
MQQQGLRVTKFLLHETGSYNKQYRRPYNTMLNKQGLNIMQERLAGSRNYVAGAFGGIANSFISPMATPEKEIEMINGWNERRMRFMMEIEHNYHTGGGITEVVLGYTSHTGVSISGAIDPNMDFFVNSTMQIRNTNELTPLGNINRSSVFDSSHVIADNSWNSIYTPIIDQRLRPEDVYSTMARSQLSGIGATALDTRSMSTTSAVKSRRSNGNAASYMARILQDYKSATALAEFGQDDAQILDNARTNSQENLVSKDPFLAALAGVRNMGIQNMFRWNDVTTLDPHVASVTKVTLMGDTQLARAHQAGMTADWVASDRVTTVATILSQSVPSLLMDLALLGVNFASTNRDIQGQVFTQLRNVEGFSSGDQSQAMMIFQQRLEQEILSGISFDNQTDFAIEMQVDLLGETWIKLSIDGGPIFDYVTPSFCDAVLVPVLTNNNDLAMNLAGDFENLATALIDAQNDHQPSIMSAGGSSFGII